MPCFRSEKGFEPPCIPRRGALPLFIRSSWNDNWRMEEDIWKDWKPGNKRAAAMAKRKNFVSEILMRQKIVIPGIEQLDLREVGRVCSDALSKGFGYDKTSKLLRQELNHPILSGAEGISLEIAWVVCATAAEEANYESYYDLGVDEVEWIGSADCCAICSLNIGQKVKVGSPFKSGHLFPPCCLSCPCSTTPAEVDYSVFDFSAKLKKELDEKK